jgi:Na+/H+ antiporter NhaC
MRTKNQNIQFINSKSQTFVFGVLFFFIGISSNAQCAMCRAALAGDSNVKKAQAVNDGIVYLMVIPYLLVGIIGILIYRMYQSKKKKTE